MSRKSGATNPEMLARFDVLGVGAREFERIAGLPYKFVDNARSGKFKSAKAAVSWKKFEAALVSFESMKGRAGAGRGKKGKTAAPAVAPIEGGTNPELADAIEEAKTISACDDLVNRILSLMAREIIEPNLGNALVKGLQEKRQILSAKAEEEERARAGEPVVIDIVNKPDWRKGGGCPYCSGKGVIV